MFGAGETEDHLLPGKLQCGGATRSFLLDVSQPIRIYILRKRFSRMFFGGWCPGECALCDKETSCFSRGADHCRHNRRPLLWA